jgi:hypothetical protein
MVCSQKQFSLESNSHKPQLIYLLLACTSTMKLHLLLLASVFNLSSGFMAELQGTLAEQACTGEEYADFKQCVTQGATADSSISEFTDFEDVAIVNRGGDDRRLLNCATQCTGYEPRGTWCFTICGSRSRRRLEEATDMPNLRRAQAADSAVYEDKQYTGNTEAKEIAVEIIDCLKDLSPNHPCLGSTDGMKLTVTL